MKLRTLKRHYDAQTTRLALAFAPDADGWRLADDDDLRDFLCGDDDDPFNRPAATCSHCSGTGGDPWNDGITPCEHCDGEGYEWWN
jgi:hypothetical protein